MARGRMMSRRISTSEQLGRVSLEAAHLFVTAIPHLDVAGQITGNPVLLKAQVVPLRQEITAETIPALIAELAASRGHEGDALVVPYEVGGVACLWFPGFTRNQTVYPKKEATPTLPSPPDLLQRNAGASREFVCPKGEVQGEGEEEGAPELDAGNWPARVSRIFSEHCGPCSPGEAGAALAPQIGQFTTEEVVRAAAYYVKHSTDKPQFKNARTFAKQLPQWVKRSAPVKMYDDKGEATPEVVAIIGRVGA